MNFQALIFTLIGFVVAAVYAFESIFEYKSNGLSAPMLVKLAISGAGVYFFFRNASRIRNTLSNGPAGEA
jgi:hypothetical protein